MKKILITLAGIASIAFSMNASATAIPADPDGAVTTVTGDVSGSDCPLLIEDININMSKNVAAAYVCNETTSIIAIATCHPNGRKPDDTNNYIYVGSSAGGSIKADTPDAVCDTGGSAADTKATTAASGS